MKPTVYIDESGDTGIKVIREDGSPGASPYFVMAAAVMERATQITAQKKLADVEERIGKKWRHATELNHAQKVFFARQSTEINLRFFAVASRKETLGEYGEEIKWNPHKFYNKCTHYLLEIVGEYLSGKGLADSDPNVVFEGRNHDYGALRNYVGKIKKNPLHLQATYLSVFNPFGFVERTKEKEPLLKFADLASHAVYQCLNKSKANFEIPEPRYLVELQKRFGADENGRVLGYGLKCIHRIEDLGLDADVLGAVKSLRAHPRMTIKRR